MDNDQETRDEGWDEGDDTIDEAADTEQAAPQEEIVPTDERTKQALAFVVDVIREMELDCKVRLRRPKEGDSPDEINIEIYGPDAGIAIGKKGQVLQALQFLTHRVVNRPTLDKRHVLVAKGGCGEKLDLYSVATQTLKPRLLVRGVDAASVRRREPYPPPPLIPGVLGARSSFA